MRLALLLLVLSSSVAAADPKSWTAVKDKLPATTDFVVVIDLKAAHVMPSFGKLFDNPLTKDAVADVKKACSLDLTSVVTDVTVVSTTDKNGGFVAFGFDGVDQAKFLDCANKWKKADYKGKGSATADKTDNAKIIDYQLHDQETEHFYASWVDKNVVAFAVKRQKTDGLDAMWKGKAASGDLATAIGKAPAGAVLWMGSGKSSDIVWASLGLTADKTAATFHAVITATSATTAAKGAKDTTDLLKQFGDGKTGPALGKATKSFKVAASGSTVTIDGTVAEADVPPAAVEVFAFMFQ